MRGLDGSVPQMAARVLMITTREICRTCWTRLRGPARLPDVQRHVSLGLFSGADHGAAGNSSSSLMPLAPRLMRDWKVLRLFLPMLVRASGQARRRSRLSRALGEQYHVMPLGMMNVLSAPPT